MFVHLPDDVVDRLVDSLVYELKKTYSSPPYLVSIGASGDELLAIPKGKMDSIYGGQLIRLCQIIGASDQDLECLRGERVLICDSIINTGDTMARAKEQVSRVAPADVKMLSLVIRNSSTIIPNFYAFSVDKHVDVYFGKGLFRTKGYNKGCIREIRPSDSGCKLGLTVVTSAQGLTITCICL